MVHVLSIWFLVTAFAGAGLVNAIGPGETRNDFARWGYPRWWGFVTGALEMAAAILIALPASRLAGLALGSAIIAAAVLTILRRREYSHLASLSVFVSLIVLSGIAP